ncbi:MAG: alanine--tRNA ligase [Myxococcales bacterium]|nr:alanine--tRNA ligase [Myxococcales bacterium]
MLTLQGSQVRASFLDFFKGKGHAVVPSANLVPQNDPTLMFTAAGMVQFKDVFTGKETRGYTRATSSQKCIRISGKHNDLENVGVTARHHTFFEMLGNFSFGDYFKDDAIAYAWELLTKVWEIPKERLVITVFGGENGIAADDEARAIWRKVTGFSDERIIGMGAKDNFWSAGDTGPCGPCTEIHYFTGDGEATLGTFGDEPGPDGIGWMEIWNLVFMQFDRKQTADGFAMTPLPKPCVDTGAGLERVTSVLQGKRSNYDSDLLRALVARASELAKKPYGATLSDDDVSMRVIADHARTTAFLIAEGVFPDRGDREYVLRRVMRRAIRHGHRLGIKEPFLHDVALRVVETMGETYPELVERKNVIADVTQQEEVRFRETIDRGLRILDDEIVALRGRGSSTLAGDVAFKLYDTYGFPLDLTEVIAKERSLEVDKAGYESALEEQKKRSEGSKVGDKAKDDVWLSLKEELTRAGSESTVFVGYEEDKASGKVLALVKDGARVARASEGDEVDVVLDRTAFYAESGGQVGDTGELSTEGATLRVSDTQKAIGATFAHRAKVVRGALAVGDTVLGTVDTKARAETRRNHSATHLLHYALRAVLGEQATQKGSLVGPSRLRFDFSHGRAVSAEEITKIEALVNAKVLENAKVVTEVLPIAEAKARGATAMFGEKYGDVVRVLTMTSDSVELCGGTHARATGDIGLFKVVSESGVAAGVRRIEAVTGEGALAYVQKLESEVRSAAQVLKAQPHELTEKLEKLTQASRALEKELAEAKRKLAFAGGGGAGEGGKGGGLDDLAARATTRSFGKVLAAKVVAPDGAVLREMAEKVRDKLGDAIVLLGAENAGKAQLVVTVSKGLVGRFRAGDLIKPVAQIVGGSGGGRPDMAQAGGTETQKLDEALKKLDELTAE